VGRHNRELCWKRRAWIPLPQRNDPRRLRKVASRQNGRPMISAHWMEAVLPKSRIRVSTHYHLEDGTNEEQKSSASGTGHRLRLGGGLPDGQVESGQDNRNGPSPGRGQESGSGHEAGEAGGIVRAEAVPERIGAAGLCG